MYSCRKIVNERRDENIAIAMMIANQSDRIRRDDVECQERLSVPLSFPSPSPGSSNHISP